METIYLLLGSNQGNSREILQEAVKRIGLLGITFKTSSIYSTKAWGNINQPDFLNQAIELKSNLTPFQLLAGIKQIEQDLGKNIIEKWGPRTIDIDILFYGKSVVSTNDLAIPHPRIQERNFVLIPLKEIASNFTHPLLNKSVLELARLCQDNLEVIKLD